MPRHKQNMTASTGPSEGDLFNVNRNKEDDFQCKELSLLEYRGL